MLHIRQYLQDGLVNDFSRFEWAHAEFYVLGVGEYDDTMLITNCEGERCPPRVQSGWLWPV
jgi:hypothetical protein